jgi:hypothetical protein
MFQVPLRHLKQLDLTGELRRVFRLLDRLAFPGTLDSMSLAVFDSTVKDISQICGPYLRGYFRRDHRLHDRLGIGAYSTPSSFSIWVSTVGEPHLWTPFQRESLPFVAFEAVLNGLTPDVLGNLCLDFIAFTPQEHVLCFRVDPSTNRIEDLLIVMPNIETLCLSNVVLYNSFLQPNPDGLRANTKLLPSLRSLHLEDFSLLDNDWGHLTTYLAHQTSGGQAISLKIRGEFPHLHLEVVKEVEGLVEEFIHCGDLETDSSMSTP